MLFSIQAPGTVLQFGKESAYELLFKGKQSVRHLRLLGRQPEFYCGRQSGNADLQQRSVRQHQKPPSGEPASPERRLRKLGEVVRIEVKGVCYAE